MTWSDRFLILFVIFVVPAVLIGLPIYLLSGGLRTFALRPLQRCYEGIKAHDRPQQGDVVFVYHTYRGLLVWFTQDEHRVYAPPADAEKLLGRLLRFNLTWGMLSRGLIFIPFLALGNYFSQRRAIERQAAELQFAFPPLQRSEKK